MLRICGAANERDTLSAAQCWCGGLFCGNGGFKRTKEFRREFKRMGTARDLVQFDDLIRQGDLFDGIAARDKWIERVNNHRPAKKRGARQCRKSERIAS